MSFVFGDFLRLNMYRMNMIEKHTVLTGTKSLILMRLTETQLVQFSSWANPVNAPQDRAGGCTHHPRVVLLHEAEGVIEGAAGDVGCSTWN